MTSQPNSGGKRQTVADFDRAIVFQNVRAGQGAPARVLPLVERALLDHGMRVEIRTASSPPEMESGVQESIKTGARLLIALGGDGTLQGLVNAAFGHDVVLGVIPAGGGNDFARALGLPREPVAALGAALRGESRPVDLARVRTSDGRTRFFLGGGGVGLDRD